MQTFLEISREARLFRHVTLFNSKTKTIFKKRYDRLLRGGSLKEEEKRILGRLAIPRVLMRGLRYRKLIDRYLS